MINGNAVKVASGRLKSAWYRARGGRPFTTGYGAYKEERVRGVLDRGEFHVNRLPDGYGLDLDERIVEYPWLFAHLPPGPGLLLDAGSALNFRFLLNRPTLADKTIYICTLAPERHSFWREGISYTFQDLRRTCFRDGFFDHVVSLSTWSTWGWTTRDSTPMARQLNAIPPAMWPPYAKWGGSFVRAGGCTSACPMAAMPTSPGSRCSTATCSIG